MLVTTLDLVGTFAFAITGCFKAIKHELDILGLFILGLMTGIGGGIVRDSILGVPPVALTTNLHFSICLLAALVSYVSYKHIAVRWNIILLVDAIGLGVFTAIGCAKAASHGFGFFGVVSLGVITAIGGGIIRDVLVSEVSEVLKSGFYATASILGAVVYFFIFRLELFQKNPTLLMFVTATIIVASRIIALKRHFHLKQLHKMPLSPTMLSYERHKKK
ncbi:MAG: trimeric intracellular cation channel family protein [Deltaproteobacteria bacterium]|nr:trimeric intracellular cation channel family protein [Deltaproteobacteria bacterium]